MKPTLIVLAGGMGSRYGGLKQIDPVGPSGEVVLDYSVFDAIAAGFGKVVFLIRKDIEAEFKAVMQPRYEGKLEIEYAFQDLKTLPEGFAVPEGRTKPWGTAHALLCCKDLVNEPFAVLNADDFYGTSSFQVMADKLMTVADKENEYCLVAFDLQKTLSDFGGVSRGICFANEEGYLEEVVETHDIRREGAGFAFEANPLISAIEGHELVSMNMWGFTPDFFPKLEASFVRFLEGLEDKEKGEFYIPTAVDELIKSGASKCEVLSSDEQWYGVTFPDDKPAVMAGIASLVESGKYPAAL